MRSWVLIASLALTAAGAAEAQAHAPGAAACEALRGWSAPPSAMGLPTRGAHVVTAEFARLPGDEATYCKLEAAIRPVDRAAPDIRVSLALPTAWPGKALMMGGGGFDGVMPVTDGPLFSMPAEKIPFPWPGALRCSAAIAATRPSGPMRRFRPWTPSSR